MILTLDTETSGLPPKGTSWKIDTNLFPYVLSISWKFKNKVHYYLIHQEGREVPAAATACNGITTRMANDRKNTKDAKWVFDLLLADAVLCHTVVGHNIHFDTSIIKAHAKRVYNNPNMLALLDEALDKDKRICTMREGQKLTGGKWPKLSELHLFLFKESFDGAHDAMADMLAAERCFFELRKRKIV